MLKLLAGVAAAALLPVHGFYLPGVAPHNYAAGEEVELKVNSLRYPSPAVVAPTIALF